MNTEKFTKEKLTRQEILSDLLAAEQAFNLRGGEAYLSAIIPCSLLAVVVGIFLQNLWIALVLATVAIFHIVRMLPLAARSRLMRRALKEAIDNDKFVITTERLCSIDEQEERANKTTRIFRFASGMSWQIPSLSQHYAWSEVCNMSSDGLDHTSLVGDEFFVVTLNDLPEISYVYNKKLFEYET